MRSSHYLFGGHLHLKHFNIVYFGHISLKFEEDRTSGCRSLYFDGQQISGVKNFVGKERNACYKNLWGGKKKTFIVYFGHISLSLKCGEDQTSGCWDIPFLIFEVFFHYSFGGLLHLKHFYSLLWSHKLKFKIWGRSDQWLLRYSIFNVGDWLAGWVAGWSSDYIATLWPILQAEICKIFS